MIIEMSIKIDFYNINDIEDYLLKFAVIAAKYEDKWIYCRHKERHTYEIPGGHRELGEVILDTAKRELYEETGAIEYNLSPICAYSVSRDDAVRDNVPSYGLLCYAEVIKLDTLPADMEMAEITFWDDLPEKLTYPHIQPSLYQKVKEYLEDMVDSYEN